MKMRDVLHALCTRRLVSSALALLVLFTFSGCGGGSGNIHGNGTSGVRGVVTYAVSASGLPPAATAFMPMSNASIVIQQTVQGGNPSIEVPIGLGPVLAKTTTDAQGNYSIPLAPGYYVVSVVVTRPTQQAQQGVTVAASQFVKQDIQVIQY